MEQIVFFVHCCSFRNTSRDGVLGKHVGKKYHNLRVKYYMITWSFSNIFVWILFIYHVVSVCHMSSKKIILIETMWKFNTWSSLGTNTLHPFAPFVLTCFINQGMGNFVQLPSQMFSIYFYWYSLNSGSQHFRFLAMPCLNHNGHLEIVVKAIIWQKRFFFSFQLPQLVFWFIYILLWILLIFSSLAFVFNVSPAKIACRYQDWEFVALCEIDFLSMKKLSDWFLFDLPCGEWVPLI